MNFVSKSFVSGVEVIPVITITVFALRCHSFTGHGKLPFKNRDNKIEVIKDEMDSSVSSQVSKKKWSRKFTKNKIGWFFIILAIISGAIALFFYREPERKKMYFVWIFAIGFLITLAIGTGFLITPNT